jgi:prepilin-type N-terminal cleavage/methylation domain-containing protein
MSRSTSAMRLRHQQLVGLIRRPTGASTTTQGLTLLECLIAIVIVSITVISITPPIFWATATRVQTRRAEQAQALAQAEIDRVRTLVERGGYAYVQLPPDAGVLDIRTNSPVAPTTSTGLIRTQSPTCNKDVGARPALAQMVPVSTKGPDSQDCTPDFLVQTFMSTGSWADDVTDKTLTPPAGFMIGVRVYSAVALDSLASGVTLEKDRASLQGTSGLGNQRTKPLAVLYSVISRNNSNKSLDIYRELCPNKGNAANGC